MRWRLVLKHVGILYAITLLGVSAFAVTSGVLLGAFGATSLVMGAMALALLAFGFGGAVMTFAWLARAEPDRPYAHTSAVVAIAYVTSYPVHVWLIGTPIDQWVPSLFALGLAALIGVLIGSRPAGSPRAQ